MLEINKEINQKYVDFYREVFKEGSLSWKMKELIALGVALGIRCEKCYKFHYNRALKAGATLEEIREVIGVAEVVSTGSVRGIVEDWLNKAVHIWILINVVDSKFTYLIIPYEKSEILCNLIQISELFKRDDSKNS